MPALVQLRCQETDLLKGIAGVRADSEIRVFCDGGEICRERGELQLTDYGISGIPIFQLSRRVNYLLRDRRNVTAQIDFLPDLTQESYEELQAGRKLLQGDRTAEEFFTGMLHKKLTAALLKMAGIRLATPMKEIPEEKIHAYYNLCRNLKLHITESNPYENAQVSAGGVGCTGSKAYYGIKDLPRGRILRGRSWTWMGDAGAIISNGPGAVVIWRDTTLR